MLSLLQAAEALHIHPQTLRAWVRDGAPVLQRGSAGRGRRALYDVAAIKAWREPSALPAASVRVLAAEFPELIADEIYEAFKAISGPHKRECAGLLAGTWYSITVRLLDRMRNDEADIPELQVLPAKVSALREVFAQSGNIASSSVDRGFI